MASDATISRFMARVKGQPEAFSYGFATMQRTLRSKVWEAAGAWSPARRATAEDPLIIDVDASLVHVHSEKENAAGTYKGGYGFSPLIAMADYGAGNGTGEVLAILMRPGNKGANSARDHIEVLSRAFAQLPEEFHDEHGGLIGGETPAMTHGSSTRRRSSS